MIINWSRMAAVGLFTADHPKMYENTCFIIISFTFIVFLCVFLSSILVGFFLFVCFSYFLYIVRAQKLWRNAVFQYALHIKPQFSKKNRSYIWMDFYKLKKNRDKIMKKIKKWNSDNSVSFVVKKSFQCGFIWNI